jgi:C_GCAxxG_C_C family probable redox protein
MSGTSAAKIVQENMKNGQNCCQAVIIAASQAYRIPVSQEILSAASLFGGGMGSGCSCGALTGMIMASGVFRQHAAHPLGNKLPQKLHDDFKKQFGTTCCRVIKSRRGSLNNIGNRLVLNSAARRRNAH